MHASTRVVERLIQTLSSGFREVSGGIRLGGRVYLFFRCHVNAVVDNDVESGLTQQQSRFETCTWSPLLFRWCGVGAVCQGPGRLQGKPVDSDRRSGEFCCQESTVW